MFLKNHVPKHFAPTSLSTGSINTLAYLGKFVLRAVVGIAYLFQGNLAARLFQSIGYLVGSLTCLLFFLVVDKFTRSSLDDIDSQIGNVTAKLPSVQTAARKLFGALLCFPVTKVVVVVLRNRCTVIPDPWRSCRYARVPNPLRCGISSNSREAIMSTNCMSISQTNQASRGQKNDIKVFHGEKLIID